MSMNTVTRRVMIGIVTLAFVVGAAAAPASASSAKERENLKAVKRSWALQSEASQKVTCQLFAASPSAIISSGVATMMGSSKTRRGMTAAAWTRVLTTYYAWACSGPGGTPR